MATQSDGSPFSNGGMDSTTTTPTSQGTSNTGVASSTLLRDHQAAFERLTNDSFNQALRINFLEERLLCYKNGTAFESEDLENEVFQLRISLQERENELKHKSLTIVRATEYMKSLQDQLKDASVEIERLRAQLQQQQQQQPAAVNNAVNSELAAQYRVELQHAHERDQSQRKRIQEIEEELGNHQDTVASMTAKHHELLQANAEKERDMERLQQVVQQAESIHSNASMEVEQWRSHGKQRDDEIARLKEQNETLGREKEHADARHQSKLKRMEEQLQTQFEQLRRESETYRAEHTRLLKDCEKAHFERERAVMEADALKQDKVRLQAEMERLAKELDCVTGEGEGLRLQNVKLTATCEHKTQTLVNYKTERENAVESFHKLENELRQWRSVCTEREMTIKTLEHRAQLAESEAKRVTTKLEMVAAHSQQSSNERLVSLEKDRHALEQDNFRLRKDVATLQHELETFEMRFKACEKQLNEENARAREFQERHAQCERELQQRNLQLEESEHRLADVSATMSTSERAIFQQQEELTNRFAAEKNELLQALHDEQEHADSLERTMAELESSNGALTEELQAVERELSVVGGRRDVRANKGDRQQSIAPQLREAIKSIQRYCVVTCVIVCHSLFYVS